MIILSPECRNFHHRWRISHSKSHPHPTTLKVQSSGLHPTLTLPPAWSQKQMLSIWLLISQQRWKKKKIEENFSSLTSCHKDMKSTNNKQLLQSTRQHDSSLRAWFIPSRKGATYEETRSTLPKEKETQESPKIFIVTADQFMKRWWEKMGKKNQVCSNSCCPTLQLSPAGQGD